MEDRGKPGKTMRASVWEQLQVRRQETRQRGQELKGAGQARKWGALKHEAGEVRVEVKAQRGRLWSTLWAGQEEKPEQKL